MPRYYEGLSNRNQQCWEDARDLCAAMGVAMPKQRANVFLQIGAQCAMFIVHCAEYELRQLIGEHPSISGWPDSQRNAKLRERVSKWCAGLEAERARWLKEWTHERDERTKQVQAWEAAVSQALKQKELSDAAATDARALALASSGEGMSMDELPVPENFKLALEHLQAVKRERAEQGLLRRRELELLRVAEPKKAIELVSEPEKPAGREQIDKVFADPEHREMCTWDWRVQLLELPRVKEVQRVWKREQAEP